MNESLKHDPPALTNPHIVELPKIIDERGNLSFIESQGHVPFKIIQTYWIYDVPGGEVRDEENPRLPEFIVALSGSFDVILGEGASRRSYTLNRSHYGLFVPKGLRRRMENFSTNSLALVLAGESEDQ